MSKKFLATALLIGFLIIAALSHQLITNRNDSPNQQTESPDTPTINLDPPTDREVKAGDLQKQEIISDEDKTGPEVAEVIIVDASQYDDEIEVRSFVSNIVRDGKCIIEFKKGGNSIIKEVNANADASSTPCVALFVARSEFSDMGTWSVTVTYTDNNSEYSGNSTTTLEIK